MNRFSLFIGLACHRTLSVKLFHLVSICFMPDIQTSVKLFHLVSMSINTGSYPHVIQWGLSHFANE